VVGVISELVVIIVICETGVEIAVSVPAMVDRVGIMIDDDAADGEGVDEDTIELDDEATEDCCVSDEEIRPLIGFEITVVVLEETASGLVVADAAVEGLRVLEDRDVDDSARMLDKGALLQSP
jgi:hypothetical protein